jgi:hypothetical protein
LVSHTARATPLQVWPCCSKRAASLAAEGTTSRYCPKLAKGKIIPEIPLGSSIQWLNVHLFHICVLLCFPLWALLPQFCILRARLVFTPVAYIARIMVLSISPTCKDPDGKPTICICRPVQPYRDKEPQWRHTVPLHAASSMITRVQESTNHRSKWK